HRRKHLRSVLVGMYRKQLEKTDVDTVLGPFDLKESVRAEELDVPTLVALSNAFREKIGPLHE
ncbi:MAG TPA: ribosomal RNA small subunit methyltransferase A, partial [Planctomycetaceae bacterium]|nr:ribosomal RNA small subunit methyltransferase A [Planctomycetaceae bacterium]